MSVLSMPPHHYLLVVHEGSGAAVWDLRAQVIVAVLSNSSDDSSRDKGSSSGGGRQSPITAAAWLPGSSKGDFATGHADGAVCIWEMPPSAGSDSTCLNSSSKAAKLPGDVLQQQRQTLQAQLVSQLHISGGAASSGASPRRQGHRCSKAAARCRAVKSLDFAAGAVECLVVYGGNEMDRPDGLTLLPLPEPKQVC
jgi:hypothetical protein